jgi:hypothetical protein
MIHSLRQQHRMIVMVLAILLPVLFALSLFVRQPFPTNNRLPVVPHVKGNTP